MIDDKWKWNDKFKLQTLAQAHLNNGTRASCTYIIAIINIEQYYIFIVL